MKFTTTEIGEVLFSPRYSFVSGGGGGESWQSGCFWGMWSIVMIESVEVHVSLKMQDGDDRT